MYGFGLGKRDDSQNADDEPDVEKRVAKGYDFGLGKRFPTGNYNFGLGKKAMPQYSFGLGKRLGYYSFGLGKRQGKLLLKFTILFYCRVFEIYNIN